MSGPGRWLTAMLLATAGTVHAATGIASFEGDWLSPAEDANDADAVVHLAPGPDALWEGSIKAIPLTRPGQPYRNDTICTACPGPLRGHALQGLGIIWGLKAQDGRLSGGHILDPGDGHVYDCEMTMSPDGKTLDVLAYKGLRLMGHTMAWRRQ